MHRQLHGGGDEKTAPFGKTTKISMVFCISTFQQKNWANLIFDLH